MAQPQGTVAHFLLGNREHAGSRGNAVAGNHHAPIVKSRLGMENRQGQFRRKNGVQLHAGILNRLHADAPLKSEQGAEPLVGKLAYRFAEIIQKIHPLKLGEGRKKRVASQLCQPHAQLRLENHHQSQRQAGGENARQYPRNNIQLKEKGQHHQGQKAGEQPHHDARAARCVESTVNLIQEHPQDENFNNRPERILDHNPVPHAQQATQQPGQMQYRSSRVAGRLREFTVHLSSRI